MKKFIFVKNNNYELQKHYKRTKKRDQLYNNK